MTLLRRRNCHDRPYLYGFGPDHEAVLMKSLTAWLSTLKGGLEIAR